MNQYLLVTDD